MSGTIPERGEYVVQGRSPQGHQWADFFHYPFTTDIEAAQQRPRAEQKAEDMHGQAPHHVTRVIRRLTREWVMKLYD